MVPFRPKSARGKRRTIASTKLNFSASKDCFAARNGGRGEPVCFTIGSPTDSSHHAMFFGLLPAPIEIRQLSSLISFLSERSLHQTAPETNPNKPKRGRPRKSDSSAAKAYRTAAGKRNMTRERKKTIQLLQCKTGQSLGRDAVRQLVVILSQMYIDKLEETRGAVEEMSVASIIKDLSHFSHVSPRNLQRMFDVWKELIHVKPDGTLNAVIDASMKQLIDTLITHKQRVPTPKPYRSSLVSNVHCSTSCSCSS